MFFIFALLKSWKNKELKVEYCDSKIELFCKNNMFNECIENLHAKVYDENLNIKFQNGICDFSNLFSEV